MLPLPLNSWALLFCCRRSSCAHRGGSSIFCGGIELHRPLSSPDLTDGIRHCSSLYDLGDYWHWKGSYCTVPATFWLVKQYVTNSFPSQKCRNEFSLKTCEKSSKLPLPKSEQRSRTVQQIELPLLSPRDPYCQKTRPRLPLVNEKTIFHFIHSSASGKSYILYTVEQYTKGVVKLYRYIGVTLYRNFWYNDMAIKLPKENVILGTIDW